MYYHSNTRCHGNTASDWKCRLISWIWNLCRTPGWPRVTFFALPRPVAVWQQLSEVLTGIFSPLIHCFFCLLVLLQFFVFFQFGALACTFKVCMCHRHPIHICHCLRSGCNGKICKTQDCYAQSHFKFPLTLAEEMLLATGSVCLVFWDEHDYILLVLDCKPIQETHWSWECWQICS